nr:hypothetical protein [uncultured Anaerobutyricum sp.]
MFKMLVRILNTLRSRIWDVLFFLFSGYSKSTVGENGGFSRRLWFPRKLNSKGLTHFIWVFSFQIKTINFWGNSSFFEAKWSIWRNGTKSNL